MIRKPFFCLFAMLALADCASNSLPEPINPIETHYQNTLSPPIGFSRVYILPPMDGNQEVWGDLYINPTEDNKTPTFKTKKNGFFAFDVRPGTYTIDFKPEDYTYFEESKSFTLLEGQTLVLRPIMHFSGNILLAPQSGDGAGILIVVAVDAVLLPVYGILSSFAAREPEFEVLNLSALQEVRSKKLAPLLPSAPPNLVQAIH